MDETTPRPSPMDAAAATRRSRTLPLPRGGTSRASLRRRRGARVSLRRRRRAARRRRRARDAAGTRASGGRCRGGEGAEGAHEKSAEVSARAPGFRAACACLLASPLTHAGLPRDALASFASPVAASACAAALRDVPGDTPEIFAIDTLLGTVTGWRAVQSAPGSAPGSASRLASAARARLATLANRAPFVDAVTTLALAARARPGPAASTRGVGLVSREGCRGVPRGGVVRPRRRRRTEAKRSVLGDVVLGDVVLGDARRRRRALRRHATVLGASGRGRGRGRGRENARWWWNDDVIRDRVSRARRRLVGAVAFAPGALSRTWSLVSSEIPTNRSLTDASEGMDTRGAWTTPTLARGAADVPERLVGVSARSRGVRAPPRRRGG